MAAVVSSAFAGAKLETLITFNAAATATPSSSSSSSASSCHFPRRTNNVSAVRCQSSSSSSSNAAATATPSSSSSSSASSCHFPRRTNNNVSVVRCQSSSSSSSNATDVVVIENSSSSSAAGNASSISALEQLVTSLHFISIQRLGHVLRLVPPPVLWIVVEMNAASTETAGILRGMGVMYRHLVCGKNLTDIKDRGVHQRNTALEHIEHHKLDGIVYFADDDNVYSLELFETLRDISRFGTWPVAMLAQSKNKATLEGPVCNGSQVIGWHTNEKSKRLRRFHVDMSGFAFNSTILWDPKRWEKRSSALIRQMDTVKEGFQETTFIEQLVEDESQMEATPSGCSKIMNWHLHLEAHGLAYPRGWLLQKNLDAVLPIE